MSWEGLPIEAGAAWRIARGLVRADRRGEGALQAGLDRARARLRESGLGSEEAASSALLLLALGLREQGADHARVVERLRCHGADDAARAAFESARVVRLTRPDLAPDRMAAARRRAAVAVFIAFALWGAVGVQLFGSLE